MTKLLKTLKLQKAVSFIHNSEESEHQFSTVADANDADETANFIMWWMWASDDKNSIFSEQTTVGEHIRSFQANHGITFHSFELIDGHLGGKTLTIGANKDYVLTSADIR